MMAKINTLGVAVVVFMTALAPQASAETDALSLEAQNCLDVGQEIQDKFAAYGDAGVPEYVVSIEIPRLTAACYTPAATAAQPLSIESNDSAFQASTLSIEETIAQLINKDTPVCSGGGATVTGWADFVTVLGIRFNVLRGPASSYWSWYDGSIAVGHTRSTLDNIEGVVANGKNVFYWDFAGVPMGGSLSLGSNCLGPLVTSTTTGVSGTPLGVSVLAPYLENVNLRNNLISVAQPLVVSAGGTTCFVPC